MKIIWSVVVHARYDKLLTHIVQLLMYLNSPDVRARLRYIARELFIRVEFKVLVQAVVFEIKKKQFKVAPAGGQRFSRYEDDPDRYALFGVYSDPKQEDITDDVREYFKEIGIGPREILRKKEWVG